MRDQLWAVVALIFFLGSGGAWIRVKLCKKYLAIGRHDPAFRRFCGTIAIALCFSLFFALLCLLLYWFSIPFTHLAWGLTVTWFVYIFWKVGTGQRIFKKFRAWRDLTEDQLKQDPTIIQPRFFAWAIKHIPVLSHAKAIELHQQAELREGAAYYAGKLNDAITLEAIRLYEEALTMEPECARIHSALGTALARVGRLDQAKEHFFRANEINPENAWIEANIARCYYELKNYTEALRWWQQANSRKP